jgi:hypothetical protein
MEIEMALFNDVKVTPITNPYDGSESIEVKNNAMPNHPYPVRYPSDLNTVERNKFRQHIYENISNPAIRTKHNINTIAGLNSAMRQILDDWIIEKNAGKKDEQLANENISAAIGVPPAGGWPAYTNLDKGTTTPPYNPNMQIYSPEDMTRQKAQLDRQRLLNPKSNMNIGGTDGKTGNLIDTLSGADLSVFFLTELPKLEDTMNDTPKHLWRKELMLMEIDSVLSATYSIMREVFPVRSVGRSKPNGFTRGPMTISGSLAFTIFTEDVLVRLRTQMQKSINDLQTKAKQVIEGYDKALKESRITSDQNVERNDKAKLPMQTLAENYALYNQILNTGGIFMLNQLLPFHILIMGTTERGIFAKMMLKNIRVIDENQMQGVQQPNIVNRISFVAEDIFPLMTGNLADSMSYSSTAMEDQNKIGGNKLSVYTGSQVMKDVSSMVSGEYRLKE